MKLSVFSAVILVLVVVWMEIYHHARELYNGVPNYRAEIGRLKADAEHLKLEVALNQEHFLEFRQNVATLMPDAVNKNGLGPNGYAYRSLASVVSRKESEDLRAVIAKTIFERGKRDFSAGHYERANGAFQEIILRFSYTSFVTESYFLMAEGYFKLNQLEACTSSVQRMIELFPDSELTGLAMVRLGSIYQIQNRNDEAVDIYKTIIRSYPQRDVAAQAKASLKKVEL